MAAVPTAINRGVNTPAINTGNATDQVMAYQYLQSLPLLAQGSANKVFVIPAELTGALGAVSRAFAPPGPGGMPGAPATEPDVEFEDVDVEEDAQGHDPLGHIMDAVEKDIEEAVIVEPTAPGSSTSPTPPRPTPGTGDVPGATP